MKPIVSIQVISGGANLTFALFPNSVLIVYLLFTILKIEQVVLNDTG